MTDSKTSKKGERGKQKVNHQEDRLSNLPNDILIKILSCLKTMEAVRSGILSTQWKSVWALVPVLDLSQSDFKLKGKGSDGDHKRKKARFLNFMDQVLIARKMPCLEKVRISGRTCDPFLLRSYVCAALERNAKELDVYFFEVPYNNSCDNLFSHNKLVILKLCGNITINFLAGSSVFPNLKVLQISRIQYRDDNTLPNLLSSCPILEDLSIGYSGYDNLGTLNIISRSVKSLKLNDVSDYNVGYAWLVDKVVFDAPAVESLKICNLETEELVVKDLSRLVDAKFEDFVLPSSSHTTKLLRGVSNVKFLSLACTVESIERPDAYDFPMFYNLTRLEISSDFPDEDPTKTLQWELLLEILKCSPMLEHLIFKCLTDKDRSGEYSKVSEWDVPTCFVSSLKTVEFNWFSSKSDLECVRYFLLYAQVLEKMMMRYIDLASKDLKSELRNAIFEIKKESVTVTWSEEEIALSFH